MNRIPYFVPIWLMITIVASSSCQRAFQYSILEVRPLSSDLNQKAIAKIQTAAARDTFSFLVISDTQIAYDELEDFVRYANRLPQDSIAFVLHAGDLTDYGASFEYNFYYEDIKKLKFPVIATIGNHDMLGNGRTIFHHYFGAEDFSFQYAHTQFIVFNSNSREVAFDGSLPNLDWLRSAQAQNQSADQIIYLSHVPPASDDFDQALKDTFHNLLAKHPKSKLSIHGHTHTYEYTDLPTDQLKYMTVPTLLDRSFVQVNVKGNTIEHALIQF